MPSTTNFSWTTPADTDLVKDGASAIRTLGNSIDTSMADLLGGTSGQVLTKNSNTNMDFAWSTFSSGSMTLIDSASLSGLSSKTFSSLPQTYENLMVRIYGSNFSSGTATFNMTVNGDTGSNYPQNEVWWNPGSTGAANTTQQTTTSWGLDAYGRSYAFQNTNNHIETVIYDYTYTGFRTMGMRKTLYTGSQYWGGLGWGGYTNTSAITSLNISVSAGTWTAGTVEIWGIK